MVYKRFIQPGRVVFINNGKYANKIVVVADIVDHGRALVENPVAGVPRQVIRFQDLNITDLLINIPHGARGGVIKKQYLKDDIDGKWSETSYAKRLQKRDDKRNMGDFSRFKSKIAKQQRSRKIKAIVKTLKKQ